MPIAAVEPPTGLRLSGLLSAGATRFGFGADSAEGAIREGGALLVRAGKAVPGYVDELLRAYREFGPYMVLAPGIALPHARPGSSVLEPCASLLTLERPVSFGHPENDPVSVVITLGGTCAEGHLALLRQLSLLLGVPGIVASLESVSSYEELERLLEKEGAEHEGAHGVRHGVRYQPDDADDGEGDCGRARDRRRG